MLYANYLGLLNLKFKNVYSDLSSWHFCDKMISDIEWNILPKQCHSLYTGETIYHLG